jgi:hypothetical protein
MNEYPPCLIFTEANIEKTRGAYHKLFGCYGALFSIGCLSHAGISA